MTTDALSVSGPHAGLYQTVVNDAIVHSDHLMARVVESTRRALQAREDQAHTVGERHALVEARRQLNKLDPVLCERFPKALRQSLSEGVSQEASRSLFTVHFDQLELMDEAQVSESVERARAQQLVVTAAEAPLADLNALICAAQGLAAVNPDRNPLRPELYVQALQAVVAQMQVSHLVRRDWMWHMADGLGRELRALYLELITRLQAGGVQPAGYAIRQSSGAYAYVGPLAAAAGLGQAPGFGPDAAPRKAHDESFLTLDRLRRLLAGELGDARSASIPESFAEKFSREFDARVVEHEAPVSDFHVTVPAAFEALKEMNQVDRMMERLGAQRTRANASGKPTVAAVDAVPGAPGRAGLGLGQALSLEVVALMVDNIARDTRLLAPVQQLVKQLEPALLQLALVDPRFFSDKEHPARRLLQEVTDRSLAFETVESHGFDTYLQPLLAIAQPLASMAIDSEEPFSQALAQLTAAWQERETARQHERARAVEALRRAEQRNLLAAKIARDIGMLAQVSAVPSEVFAFLSGPWAQVMAQARMNDDSGHNDPGRYRELVDALLWSAQPELTRKNVGRLVRLIPKLLSKLREGLAMIDYPATQTSAFFDLLIKLHQQAFRVAPAGAQEQSPKPVRKVVLRDDDEPWIAPSEARESGFMESAVDSVADDHPVTDAASADMLAATQASEPVSPLDVSRMAIGAWVELLVAGSWERTQLSWASPHGTLFLFTNAYGGTQSMTRRSLDKLLTQGAMRVISQQTVVEGALDAVAQVAMRNSVDVKL
jgi:hypothetical protein